jgi:hypothetical protein
MFNFIEDDVNLAQMTISANFTAIAFKFCFNNYIIIFIF